MTDLRPVLNGLEKQRFSLYPRDLIMEQCFLADRLSPFTPRPQLWVPCTMTWEEAHKRRPGCKSTHCTCNLPVAPAQLRALPGYGSSFIDIRDLPEKLPHEQDQQLKQEQKKQHDQQLKQHQQPRRGTHFATPEDFGMQQQPKKHMIGRRKKK